MDFSNDNEPWEWQGEDYHLKIDSQLDISSSLWDEVNDKEDDFLYMFEKTTPVKACSIMDFHVADSGGIIKEPEACRESSQSKRRRMLQFNTDKQASSAFTNSKDMENSLMEEDTLPDNLQWTPSFSERCTYGNEDLDQGWLTNCFIDNEMHISSNEMAVSGAADDQVDISEFCNIPSEVETDKMQECPNPPLSRCIFRGKKSFIRTPTKLATSVAYPFALIKPCGVQGDVTLKDINQRIRTPPPRPAKKEDPSTSYPTSAFSGKPVVVKTKIRTEGGRGSITIMRTKG
ncbi:protein XRI1-like isoform X2 [Aristolochia californica]|uniref:protein XRI1-like isoform X2 n=1 Tax=Aristolochia californica TaxID=171875 RepID=UPI0035D992AF